MFGKLRKPVVAVALAVAAVAGGAGTAYATISYVGGGTWDHGVGGGTVWSDYYHGSKCHGSSVQGEAVRLGGPVVDGRRAQQGLRGRQGLVRHLVLT
ncbi:MAG: lactococcin 972 family bacteriocin [Cellulosimicrobium cellulans]